eukprot:TRINITY_DN2634_c0_g1_i1.p1 TRINITY_DN2634_c0_g1~~TRINITY_DN2634_c0_g1_i1.p1  ORF type:complete len:330 (+),score=66.72 TRINITY_DN2634_c0_g1_i1:714-1703(+)
MPKTKNTTANKRKERNKARLKAQNDKQHHFDLKNEACNVVTECSSCGQQQRNRAFCYFCNQVSKLPMCAQCGRQKCMGGDCTVPHPGKNATAMTLVGAVCDFCEAFICHSRKCLTTHACRCPLQEADCVECSRSVWEHGGRLFKCSSCDSWICEDDQFEHQASCQVLEGEDNHCASCNRLGTWTCLRCKIAFCDNHVKSKLTGTLKKGENYKCKKCGFELQEAKMLSMSVRKHEFGRQGGKMGESSLINQGEDEDYYDGGLSGQFGQFGFGGQYAGGGVGGDDDDDDDDYDYDDDDEEEDDDEAEENQGDNNQEDNNDKNGSHSGTTKS